MYNKVEKVKSSKLFRIWDILVYILLLVLIIILLWAFIWRVPKTDIEGIEILIKNDVVLSYNFDNNKIKNSNSDYINVSENDLDITIMIYTDKDKKDFNKIIIDKKNRTAYIDDANCSKSKDCTKMNAIKHSGESIICVPHQLILRSIGEEIIKDPISG